MPALGKKLPEAKVSDLRAALPTAWPIWSAARGFTHSDRQLTQTDLPAFIVRFHVCLIRTSVKQIVMYPAGYSLEVMTCVEGSPN